MADQTTTQGLWQFGGDNASNWHHYFNANIDILNNVALKLQGLADVNIVSLKDKSILKYNAGTGKWDVTVRRS